MLSCHGYVFLEPIHNALVFVAFNSKPEIVLKDNIIEMLQIKNQDHSQLEWYNLQTVTF